METLYLHIPFNRQAFIRSNELRHTLSLKPYKIRLTGEIITSISALIVCTLVFKVGSSFHFFVYVSLCFVIVTLLSLQSFISAKKKNSRAILDMANEHEREQWVYNYEFNNEGIKYSDKEKSMSYNWSKFDGYTLYEDHLVLIAYGGFANAYFFSRQQLGEAQFEELLDRVKQKLALKTMRKSH